MNLKELKGPIQEQENNIVIWITTKQYINERLIQEIKFSNKFFFFRGGAGAQNLCFLKNIRKTPLFSLEKQKSVTKKKR